jgi:hypothetical protein
MRPSHVQATWRLDTKVAHNCDKVVANRLQELRAWVRSPQRHLHNGSLVSLIGLRLDCNQGFSVMQDDGQ